MSNKNDTQTLTAVELERLDALACAAQPKSVVDVAAEVRKAVEDITGPGFLVRLAKLNLESIIARATPQSQVATYTAGTPRVDALMAKWDDDGATRGSAFIELRDLARELERAAHPAPAAQAVEARFVSAKPGFNTMTLSYTGSLPDWIDSDMLLRVVPAAAAPAGDAEDAQTQAARDVLAERRRQIEREGWTPGLDDSYKNLELNRAAVCYLSFGQDRVPSTWPWSGEWWKPTNYRRNLVKAGALILAEIERLDRAATAEQKGAA